MCGGKPNAVVVVNGAGRVQVNLVSKEEGTGGKTVWCEKDWYEVGGT